MNEFKLVLSTGEFLSLLSQLPDGIHIKEWNPRIAQRKSGGAFQDSPISPGRRLVYEQFADVQEDVNFAVVGLDENDALIQLTELLRDYTEQIINYWINDWETTFCYLQITTKNGNTFYAVLKYYTLPEISNPFAQPMFSKLLTPNMPELSLILEREAIWSKFSPGNGENLTILVKDVEYSDQGISYMTNFFSEVELTHIFVDDGGVFSVNQVASTSFDLLPAAPVVNDAIYFGNSDGYPFHNIIFDIAQAFAGTSVAIAYEYWGGASWVATGVETDETDDFQNTGVGIFTWLTSESWATTTVNGVNALWIRFRITSATGVTTNPTQQNRIIYTNTSPYFEVSSDDIAGEQDALIKANFNNVAGYITNIFTYTFARRTLARGSSFNAYINISDRQVPTGITISLDASRGVSYATDKRSPNGRVVQYSSGGDAIGLGIMADRFNIDLSGSLSAQYSGKFHGFFVGKVEHLSAIRDYLIEVRIENQSETIEYYNSGELSIGFTDFNGQEVIELPEIISIPNNPPPLRITLAMERVTSGMIYNFLSFVFLPIDEMAIMPASSAGSSDTHYLQIDSFGPRKKILSAIKNIADNTDFDSVLTITNSTFSLKPNASQRVWSFCRGSLNYTTSINWAHKVANIQKNERFLSLRGNQ